MNVLRRYLWNFIYHPIRILHYSKFLPFFPGPIYAFLCPFGGACWDSRYNRQGDNSIFNLYSYLRQSEIHSEVEDAFATHIFLFNTRKKGEINLHKYITEYMTTHSKGIAYYVRRFLHDFKLLIRGKSIIIIILFVSEWFIYYHTQKQQPGCCNLFLGFIKRH